MESLSWLASRVTKATFIYELYYLQRQAISHGDCAAQYIDGLAGEGLVPDDHDELLCAMLILQKADRIAAAIDKRILSGDFVPNC